jgi:ABC-2 type transport system permease protein
VLNFWKVLQLSLKNMLAKPLWLLLVATVCIASLPYLGRTIDNLPVAVVDMDHTSASRQLSRLLDAAPKIAVRGYDNLPDAKRDLAWRELYGVIIIPVDFEKRLLRGESLVVPVFGDATNRMANGQIQQDITATYNQLLNELNRAVLMREGFSERQADVVLRPLITRLVDLYNPGTSFAAIVLPGLVTLVLQHGLLLSSTRINLNLRGGTPRSLRQPLSTRLGRYAAQLLVWMVLAMLLYVIWPHIFGFRQTASFWALLGLILPFLLAVLAFSEFLAELLPSEEAVYLTLTFVTMPLFYLAGYTWPPQAMPEWVLWLANAIPSTWAIRAVAEMNQMNLPLVETGQHVLILLALAAGYGLAGTLIYQWRNYRRDHGQDPSPLV